MTSTDVARANIEAFNVGDWKGLAATFADKCVYDELATHRHLEGQEAIVEANRGWKEAFPDATGRIERAISTTSFGLTRTVSLSPRSLSSIVWSSWSAGSCSRVTAAVITRSSVPPSAIS